MDACWLVLAVSLLAPLSVLSMVSKATYWLVSLQPHKGSVSSLVCCLFCKKVPPSSCLHWKLDQVSQVPLWSAEPVRLNSNQKNMGRGDLCSFWAEPLKTFLFIYSLLCWVVLVVLRVFSSCSGRGLLLVAVHRLLGFSGDAKVKNLPANAGDAGVLGWIPSSGRSSGGGSGNPLQYSCLGNPMDRGAWWATVHGVAKSRTGLWAHVHTHRLLTMVVPLVAEHGFQTMGFSSCLAPCGMWDLPWAVIEPMSPAITGGFLTTKPPRKSWAKPLKNINSSISFSLYHSLYWLGADANEVWGKWGHHDFQDTIKGAWSAGELPITQKQDINSYYLSKI